MRVCTIRSGRHDHDVTINISFNVPLRRRYVIPTCECPRGALKSHASRTAAIRISIYTLSPHHRHATNARPSASLIPHNNQQPPCRFSKMRGRYISVNVSSLRSTATRMCTTRMCITRPCTMHLCSMGRCATRLHTTVRCKMG